MTTEPTPQLRALEWALEDLDYSAPSRVLEALRRNGFDIVAMPPQSAPDAVSVSSGTIPPPEAPEATKGASEGDDLLRRVEKLEADAKASTEVAMANILLRLGDLEHDRRTTNEVVYGIAVGAEERVVALEAFQRRVEAVFEGLKVRDAT